MHTLYTDGLGLSTEEQIVVKLIFRYNIRYSLHMTISGPNPVFNNLYYFRLTQAPGEWRGQRRKS